MSDDDYESALAFNSMMYEQHQQSEDDDYESENNSLPDLIIDEQNQQPVQEQKNANEDNNENDYRFENTVDLARNLIGQLTGYKFEDLVDSTRNLITNEQKQADNSIYNNIFSFNNGIVHENRTFDIRFSWYDAVP